MDFYKGIIPYKYSVFNRLTTQVQEEIKRAYLLEKDKNYVSVIAYCIMPTHIHIIIKQLCDNGISKYMNNTLNSYSRYFNVRNERRGPLWESRFKSIHIENDEQLLHLTRYIHLNPVSARLVDKPEEWVYSSYKEYLRDTNKSLCDYGELIEINPLTYQSFVNERIDYQRELSKIKSLLLENYSG